MSKQQRDELDQPITEQELTDAVFSMQNLKAPGIDSLLVDWHKIFWDKIKSLLLLVYQEAIKIGQLHLSARRGVICLIPKKEREPRLLKNWRPTTLLNMDYKIKAKLKARRLKTVLHFIISRHQTGYVEGRFYWD